MGPAAVSVTPQTAARWRSTIARSAMRAHARTRVASACKACGEPTNAQKSTRRYCSSLCRQRAYRYRVGRRPMVTPIAHQRRIRDCEAALYPRPIMASLEGCAVERIPFAEAKALITRYEWLGAMPPGARACYGLKTPDGELVGVVVFGPPPSPESRDLCGPEHRDLTICLARGACVHWAHPHAASFMISRACKLAHQEHGWSVFFAYSDPMAGEIGTVYQACNWRYLGVAVGRTGGKGRWRFFDKREGRWRSDRMLSRHKLKVAEVRAHPRLDRRMDARQGPLCVVRGDAA
jgi:hypothetical protein